MPLLNNLITSKVFAKKITFKPISVPKLIEFGLFGDTIFDATGNITFTGENFSHILLYLSTFKYAKLKGRTLLFKFGNVSYLLGHPAHEEEKRQFDISSCT